MLVLGRELKGAMNYSVVLFICQVVLEARRHLSSMFIG